MTPIGDVDDDLWSAIGDPMRRRLLDLLLRERSGTATTLSSELPVTRQAVSKHLDVLVRAGLVRAEQTGRERRYRVDENRFGTAISQLSTVTAGWDARLSRIRRLAETIQQAREE